MTFEELGLSEKLLKAIEEVGYSEPTPIQAQAIPIVLMARDVVGVAQTGTGKTASFTLPMIEILDGGRAKARMPRSLILTPTRELAAQIAENFETYGKYHKLNMALLVGGVSMDEQVKKLDRGVDVLIATPGRLLDLFGRGKILLNDIKVLVIDEADRMLDMGFIPDIEKIAALLPFTRQTLLFSATMQPEIRKLTEKFLSNPKEVSVARAASTAKTVEQFIVKVAPKNKDATIAKLIKDENVQNAFIFCNRKRDIDGLTRYLKNKGYDARGLHGDMPQSSRTETLEDFKAGRLSLLVCSDVAARGLDVQGLSHVFNYDVPFNSDDYVHRIGRTGRAGMSGRAWMLVTNSEQKYLDSIEKLIREDITVVDVNGSGGAPAASAPAKSSKPKDDKPRDDKPRGDSKPKRAPKKDTPRDEAPKNNDRPQKRASQDDNSSSVKGFGNDLPDFLK
jgi:superfamily II DNA/RNA helicase